MKEMRRLCGVIVLLSSLLVSSCNKDIVEIPESNDPVFRTSGVFGGESFEIVAGDNNAYMYTMTQQVNGVDVFSGRIADGLFSLEMGIYDGEIDTPGSNPVNNLSNLSMNFSHSDSVPMIQLSKSVLVNAGNQSVQSINWYVDGEWKGLNDWVIDQPGHYDVCAEVKFIGGEVATFCNDVIAGYTRNANFTFDYLLNQGGDLMADINNLGNAISSVSWLLDDVPVSGSGGENHTAIIPAGFHVLSAEVQFANGAIRKKSILVNGTSNELTCGDFSIFEEIAPQIEPRDYTIRLLVEHDNRSYTSESAKNESAVLAITGLDYYGENANGKPVYKVSASVQASMHELGTFKTKQISFATVFGIEIP